MCGSLDYFFNSVRKCLWLLTITNTLSGVLRSDALEDYVTADTAESLLAEAVLGSSALNPFVS